MLLVRFAACRAPYDNPLAELCLICPTLPLMLSMAVPSSRVVRLRQLQSLHRQTCWHHLPVDLAGAACP